MSAITPKRVFYAVVELGGMARRNVTVDNVCAALNCSRIELFNVLQYCDNVLFDASNQTLSV